MERVGRFEIVGELGRGGFGRVYEGHDPVINRKVAIKLLHETAASLQNDDSTPVTSTEAAQRFRREVQAAGRLSHPNIVQTFDFGQHEGSPFIVMELLDGRDLKGLMYPPDNLPLEVKTRILIDVAQGLHHAHTEGIVHRDIKPGNIHLCSDGTSKITDFGLAKLTAPLGPPRLSGLDQSHIDPDLTRDGVILGTPRYMSPEQVANLRLDGRSDIFSLGVVAYELLAGNPPFRGKNPTALLDSIQRDTVEPLDELSGSDHEWLQPIVMRCLFKSRSERWPNGEALADALLQSEAPDTSSWKLEAERQAEFDEAVERLLSEEQPRRPVPIDPTESDVTLNGLLSRAVVWQSDATTWSHLVLKRDVR